MIGLAHHTIITFIKHMMVKKVNQDMEDTIYISFRIIIMDIIFWLILFINRMVKNEEISQTLKFVEDKLESFYKQKYDGEKNNDFFNHYRYIKEVNG